MSKPRVVKDYQSLPEEIKKQILSSYPRGIHKHLIKFKNAKGKLQTALPFESDTYHYMVRMSESFDPKKEKQAMA